ncbi:ced-10 [Acrasis kona]|uniref:Ced-10 n=1 Tax=Acrasis kona TaxID=1008807 RepID=A0AAW2Z8U0_9EUKA
MLRGLHGHTTCSLEKDGETIVYVFGGSQEVVESGAHIQIQTNNKIQPRSFSSSFCKENELFVFGGKANGYLNDIWCLDLETNIWSQKLYLYDSESHVPSPRYGQCAVLLDNKAYVYGGYDNNGFTDNYIYIYQIDENKWLHPVKITDVPSRFHHSMVLVGDVIYIYGGCNENRTCFGDFFSVNTQDFSVTTITGEDGFAPSARFGHCMYYFDEMFYIIGGTNNSKTDFNQVQCFNKAKMWVKLERPYDCLVFATVACSTQGEVNLFGGVTRSIDSSTPTSTTQHNQDENTSIEDLRTIINNLSEDVIISVLQFCDYKTLGNTFCASKSWRISKLAGANILWDQYTRKVTESVAYMQFVQNEKTKSQINELLNCTCYPYETNFKQCIDLIMKARNDYNKQPQFDARAESIIKSARRYTKPDNIVNFVGPIYKVVQVGDGAAGKTCLWIRSAQGLYPTDYVPTVFDNYNACIKRDDGVVVCINCWDTAGPEDYDRLRPLSYPQTDLFLITFNVMNRRSFVNVEEKWIPEVTYHCPGAHIILIGAKRDLRRDQEAIKRVEERKMTVVQEYEALNLVRKYNLGMYFETSSLEGYGADDLIAVIAEFMRTSEEYEKKNKKKKCKVQ